eukprot:Pgem_evm1s18937
MNIPDDDIINTKQFITFTNLGFSSNELNDVSNFIESMINKKYDSYTIKDVNYLESLVLKDEKPEWRELVALSISLLKKCLSYSELDTTLKTNVENGVKQILINLQNYYKTRHEYLKTDVIKSDLVETLVNNIPEYYGKLNQKRNLRFLLEDSCGTRT